MQGCVGAEPAPPRRGASAAAVSAVLGDDDLLREILLRLGFPTTLVRAALVSKRWLRHAADPAFLRRFRDRHPPALLGFYVREAFVRRTRFVPVSQAPELAAAVRRASFADGEFAISDCRNGRVLVTNLTTRQNAVFSPLHPTRGKLVLPPLPSPDHASRAWFFLPGDEGAVAVEVRLIGRQLHVHLSTLQSGVWVVHTSAAIDMPEAVPNIGRAPMVMMLRPIRDKIYMMVDSRHILRLDMAATSGSVLQLPDRVRADRFALSCGEDCGLILAHAEGYLFSIWRLAMNRGGANDWVLVYDRIPVREAQDRLDEVMVIAVDDTVEFAFLGLKASKLVMCMHLRSRVEKVYEKMMQHMLWVTIFPFKMVWPPTFPALMEENNEAEG